jgi:hypothetical protein
MFNDASVKRIIYFVILDNAMQIFTLKEFSSITQHYNHWETNFMNGGFKFFVIFIVPWTRLVTQVIKSSQVKVMTLTFFKFPRKLKS